MTLKLPAEVIVLGAHALLNKKDINETSPQERKSAAETHCKSQNLIGPCAIPSKNTFLLALLNNRLWS